MRERFSEAASVILCLVLLFVIPLFVAIIVASPFAIYHVILNGWQAGWKDLMESSRFIGYFWGLMVAGGLLWTIATALRERVSRRSASTSSEF